MFLIDTIQGYKFISKSNGIVVLHGHIYQGYFDTMEMALERIFGDISAEKEFEIKQKQAARRQSRNSENQ